MTTEIFILFSDIFISVQLLFDSCLHLTRSFVAHRQSIDDNIDIDHLVDPAVETLRYGDSSTKENIFYTSMEFDKKREKSCFMYSDEKFKDF